MKILEFGGSSTADVVALFGRFSNIDNYYVAALRPDGRASIRASVGGSPPATIKTSANFGVAAGVWYRLRFELVGVDLRLYVDDTLRVEVQEAQLTQGTVAVGGTNSAALFDNVRVTLPRP